MCFYRPFHITVSLTCQICSRNFTWGCVQIEKTTKSKSSIHSNIQTGDNLWWPTWKIGRSVSSFSQGKGKQIRIWHTYKKKHIHFNLFHFCKGDCNLHTLSFLFQFILFDHAILKTHVHRTDYRPQKIPTFSMVILWIVAKKD